MGFKRSVERMEQIEKRLRDGMAKRGIRGSVQDDIVRSITSFALYGFPESHAASFALLAYASAYLRAHHHAAFTCAMLNNWPMGFYHPATLVKDAQRHGVRVLPVDVTRSGWKCGVETLSSLALRLGLRYVGGLREEAGKRIEAERAKASFESIGDVINRCGLRNDEIQSLAHVGAFAAFGQTRREALWQAAAVPRDPLFASKHSRPSTLDSRPSSPLPEMSLLDRTLADYKSSGITVGPHIVKHLREELKQRGVLGSVELKQARNGQWAKIAGLVIVRQRPGTAKGMCFITLEDEAGTSNAAVMPHVFKQYRSLIHTAALLQIEGPLQKVDGVIHVLARRIEELKLPNQTITQSGSGYRMRTTPAEDAVSPTSDQPPNNQQLASLPKSHDFR
jgi:error-prone DNA polymerase